MDEFPGNLNHTTSEEPADRQSAKREGLQKNLNSKPHYSTRNKLSSLINGEGVRPLLLLGNAKTVLEEFPDDCIDCAITSPPYWGKRVYAGGGIGLEESYDDYIAALADVFLELKRVLKPTGSFWLNIGDTYRGKSLVGIPWRVAMTLTDEQSWTLRNSIIWNKVKSGMDNTKDRLGNVHENVFHFVKSPKGYFYDTDAIRSKPREAIVKNGTVISATGVSGVRYRRQIELSTSLSTKEKEGATAALDAILKDVTDGKLSDFRMIIRGQQRATHSDSEKVSGRAKELKERGFYFLKYHPKGSKPTDVWDILPEDTQKRKSHFAAFPEDLCRIPILSTCPKNGIVLDPFCGTGTALKVAMQLERKSIGIDCSSDYLELAEDRCLELL
ncbi:MAG: DNA-methyltransferase [Rhodospirillales bacterium]